MPMHQTRIDREPERMAGKLTTMPLGRYGAAYPHRRSCLGSAIQNPRRGNGHNSLAADERVELLRQVFWDMCEITTATQTVDVPDSDPDDEVDDSHTGIALTITITAKTAEQMRLIYAFAKYQNDALDILLENLPDDLGPARKAVVETAVQLVGRVSYFWGGKSLTRGWDDRWGVPTEVTAAGSGSTGTVRPFGLDCSGFVDWTFYNATNGSYYPGRGGGAATQHSYCTNISWSDASRAIWCFTQMIPTSVSSAARTRTAIS